MPREEEEEEVEFRSADGVRLCGRLCRGGLQGVVITHPHSKLGGNQDNNVVRAVQRALRRSLGLTTLTFDFRGVGASGGSASWTGKSERHDVTAAVDFLLEHGGASDGVWVAGYSFGAAVASQPAAAHPRVRGYAGLSYPAGRLASVLLEAHWKEGVEAIGVKPKLFVIGTNDQFADGRQLGASVAALQLPSDFVLVPDADHFWMRHEDRLTGPLVEWLQRHTEAPPPPPPAD